MLVQVGPVASFGELGRHVSVALQYPFGGQKSFDTDGTACVYPGRADANLGAWKKKKKTILPVLAGPRVMLIMILIEKPQHNTWHFSFDLHVTRSSFPFDFKL